MGLETKRKAAQKYSRLIGKREKSGETRELALETLGAGGRMAEAPVMLPDADMSEKVARLRERLERELSTRREELEKLDLEIRAIVDQARAGLEKIAREGPNADLTPDDELGLEAIVETDGSRPSLSFVDDELVFDGQELGEWEHVVRSRKEQIEQGAKSVGRIDLDGVHCGTGFSFGDGIILTNRHVLDDIADIDSAGAWRLRGDVTIDFGSGPEPELARRFGVMASSIVAGQNDNGGGVDFATLDYAVLHCRIPDGAAFPPPITPETNAGHIVVSRPVYAIGYPAEPRPGQYPFSLLAKLFDYRFGVKRFSPGEIDATLGFEDGDIHATVLRYDSTTLPGSSGSPVVDVGTSGIRALGLHFAGWSEGNYAHALSASYFRQRLESKGVPYPAQTSS